MAGDYLKLRTQDPTQTASPDTPIKEETLPNPDPASGYSGARKDSSVPITAMLPQLPMGGQPQGQGQSRQPMGFADQISSMITNPVFAALLGALATRSMTPKNYPAFGPMVMGGMQTFGAARKSQMEEEKLRQEERDRRARLAQGQTQLEQDQQRIALEKQRVDISGRTETRQGQKELEERQMRERMLESYTRIHEAILSDPGTDPSLKQTAKMLDPSSPNYFDDLTKLRQLDINMKNATTRAELEAIRGQNAILQQRIEALRESKREGKEAKIEEREKARRRAVLQDDVAAARREYNRFLEKEYGIANADSERKFPFGSWYRQIFPGRYKEAVEESLIIEGAPAPVAPRPPLTNPYTPRTPRG